MSTPAPPTKIACPHCQGQIKSPGLPTGSQVTCPKCGKAFRLGEKSGAGGREPGVGSRESVGGRQKSEVRGREDEPPAEPRVQGSGLSSQKPKIARPQEPMAQRPPQQQSPQ